MINLISMIGHNQEIDLSLRKLDNTFILGKRATKEEIVGIGIKTKANVKMKKMAVRKIL